MASEILSSRSLQILLYLFTASTLGRTVFSSAKTCDYRAYRVTLKWDPPFWSNLAKRMFEWLEVAFFGYFAERIWSCVKCHFFRALMARPAIFTHVRPSGKFTSNYRNVRLHLGPACSRERAQTISIKFCSKSLILYDSSCTCAIAIELLGSICFMFYKK